MREKKRRISSGKNSEQARTQNSGQWAREVDLSLISRIQSGDDSAVGELIKRHHPYIVKVAKQYTGITLQNEDLRQEASIGMIEAARRFDPSKGVKFLTYADHWMRRSIKVALRDTDKMVRLPPNKVIKIRNLKNLLRDLSNKMHRKARINDLPVSGRDSAHELLKDDSTQTVSSLSTPIKGDDDKKRHLGDFVADENLQSPFDALLVKDRFSALSIVLMSKLNENEARVIYLRYWENRTLREAGEEMSLSRERIRQIEDKALGKLARSPILRELSLNNGTHT